MSKPIEQENADHKLGLDKNTLKLIDKLVVSGLPKGDTLAILEDLKKWHEDNCFLTEGQRILVRNIAKDYKEHPYWVRLMSAVNELYNDRCTPPSAASFIEDVNRYFLETNKLSHLQQEQIITIHEQAKKFLQEREEVLD